VRPEALCHWKIPMTPFMPLVISAKSRIKGLRGHVACIGERRGPCRVLVGKPEGNRSHEIHKRK